LENKKESIHSGHRDRMRARFLETGGRGMADHELLELLLYYAVLRRDTNDTAHRLIEAFGSFSAVLEADPDLLCKVEGVGPGVAAFLSVIGESAARYAKEKITADTAKDVYDTAEKVVTYLASRYVGVDVERVYLLLFDNAMHMIDCFHVCDGSITGAYMSVRRITERAYRKGAAAAILAHNHPGGMASPSYEDLRVTRRLGEAMRLLEIPLLEHYIIAGSYYCSAMQEAYAQEPETKAASSLIEIMERKLKEPKGIRED
jgi:DNA repair protein RadC